jgi:hypothetical protein
MSPVAMTYVHHICLDPTHQKSSKKGMVGEWAQPSGVELATFFWREGVSEGLVADP